MTPQLRFPEFTDAWQARKLGDVFDITRGNVLATSMVKSKRDDAYSYPVYSSQTKSDGLMGYYNDFLYEDAITWTTDGANAGEVQFREGKFYCTNVCGVLMSKNGYANKAIAESLNLITHKYVSYVGNPKLMNNTMAGISLVMASVAEQQKIADYMGGVDSKLTSIQTKVAAMHEYKKGVMQALFSGKLRFKDENDNPYPDWEEKTLNEIVTINPKTSELPEKFIYIDLESVAGGTLLAENLITKALAPSRAQRLLQRNDILFQTVRPYQRNNLFFDLKGDYVASTGYAQIRYTDCAEFMYHLIHTDSFVNKVLKYCTGTNYPAINSTDLGKVEVKIPQSSEEQQKIADFLSALDDKIKLEEAKLASAKEFKKALLQRMFV